MYDNSSSNYLFKIIKTFCNLKKFNLRTFNINYFKIKFDFPHIINSILSKFLYNFVFLYNSNCIFLKVYSNHSHLNYDTNSNLLPIKRNFRIKQHYIFYNMLTSKNFPYLNFPYNY